MKSTTDFDRLVESWLQDAGPADIRNATVATALEAARRTSQRRGPLTWLTGPAAWPKGSRHAARFGDVPLALRLTVVVGLLALAVAALALVGVGSSPTPSNEPRPSQLGVVVAPPAPSATPLPGLLPCQAADGFIGGVAASTGALPPVVPSGGAQTLLVTLAVPGAYEIATLDPTRADATPTRLIGIGSPGHRLVPSPDGRAFAISVAGGSTSIGCAEPVVVSRAGDWYTSPFPVNQVDVVDHLTWSRDGGILYGIHATTFEDPNATLPADRGSVWAWNARTGTVEQLGSPCEGCRLGDPAVSPDGTLAVAFHGPTCSDEQRDPDHLRLECGDSGVAVLGQDGWRTVTTSSQMLASAPNSVNLLLLGWSDASTLVLGSPTTGVTRLALDGSLTPVGLGGECCNGSGDWLVLSPDGTTAALNIADGDYVHHEIFLTPVDGGQARMVGRVVSQEGYLGQPAWSPDGRTIATLRTAITSGNSSTTSYSVLVVPVDGSATRQFPLSPATGDPSDIAWLPPAR